MGQLQNEILLVGYDKNLYDFRTAMQCTEKQTHFHSMVHGMKIQSKVSL